MSDLSAYQFTAGWYDRGEVHLSFWQDGERMVYHEPFRWYFFMERGNVERVRRELERHVDGLELTPGGRHYRVYVDYWERKDLLARLEDMNADPLEGDVYPLDRYMADNDVRLDPSPRVLLYDLETDSRTGWDDIEGHRVLTVAYRGPGMARTEYLKAPSADDEGERKLLDQFLDLVVFHDILGAWNGDDYDEKVLRARCRRQGLRPAWRQVRFLDTMQLFKKYYQRDAEGAGVRTSFSLENIAQTMLGKGKLEEVPPQKILQLFHENPELLIRYNIRDVDLMSEIEGKTSYLETHTILSHLCNRFMCSKSLKQAHVTDGFVLKYGAKKDIHFPTKYYDDDAGHGDDGPGFEGAHVEEPVVGLHEGVVDLDLKSLYPNIVMAWNISPETRLPDVDESRAGRDSAFLQAFPPITSDGVAVAANGAVFRTDFVGVFPAVSRIAVDARQEFYEKAMALERAGQEGTDDHRLSLQTSNVYKILSNAFFGGMGSPYMRYHDPLAAEAISVTGKAALRRIFAHVEEKGLVKIYGDTDSSFVKCTVPVAEEFCDSVGRVLDVHAAERGARTGGFTLKIDAVFERIFFTTMKKYAGKKTTGKKDVRGLEMIRSDGCRYAREMQRRIIDFVLEAERPTPATAERLARGWCTRLFSGQLSADDLKITVGLNKPFEEYTTDQDVHVRVAKQMLAAGREVYVQMKIPYVLAGLDEKGRQHGIHADDFDGNYDAGQYWKKIYPPTKRILMAVFPDDKMTWERLQKWRPDDPQADMFDGRVPPPPPPPADGPVTLRLYAGDQGCFEEVRAAAEQHPGPRALLLDLRTEDAEMTLRTCLRVRLDKDLVKQVEKVVGHRAYYGPEVWDQGG